MKRCNTCGIEKVASEFHANNKTQDKLCKKCKSCSRRRTASSDKTVQNAYWNKWRKDNPEKVKGYFRKMRYGLEPGQYDEMVKTQGGLCALCRLISDKPLHIDHDHATGRIRQLLCDRCNRGIGYLNEDPDLLERAASYLRSYSQPKVQQPSSSSSKTNSL